MFASYLKNRREFFFYNEDIYNFYLKKNVSIGSSL